MFLSPLGPVLDVNGLVLALTGSAKLPNGTLARTTQGFLGGANCNPATLEGCHRAWDVAVPSGTPLRAAHSGKITEAGDTGGSCGITVVVEGLFARTRICHLSQVSVGIGTSVSKGDVIGFSGNTGTSTGPHEHEQFAFRGSDTLRSPRLYLGISEGAGWLLLLAGGAFAFAALTE